MIVICCYSSFRLMLKLASFSHSAKIDSIIGKSGEQKKQKKNDRQIFFIEARAFKVRNLDNENVLQVFFLLVFIAIKFILLQ
jgi:hypothetical protein